MEHYLTDQTVFEDQFNNALIKVLANSVLFLLLSHIDGGDGAWIRLTDFLQASVMTVNI
jgi:hypothetical protein